VKTLSLCLIIGLSLLEHLSDWEGYSGWIEGSALCGLCTDEPGKIPRHGVPKPQCSAGGAPWTIRRSSLPQLSYCVLRSPEADKESGRTNEAFASPFCPNDILKPARAPPKLKLPSQKRLGPPNGLGRRAVMIRSALFGQVLRGYLARRSATNSHFSNQPFQPLSLSKEAENLLHAPLRLLSKPFLPHPRTFRTLIQRHLPLLHPPPTVATLPCPPPIIVIPSSGSCFSQSSDYDASSLLLPRWLKDNNARFTRLVCVFILGTRFHLSSYRPTIAP
jgi:hypothetical protein